MSVTQQVYYTPDMQRLFGRSREWIDTAIREGYIPKPIRLGKRNAWKRVEIDRLLGLDAAAPAQLVAAGAM